MELREQDLERLFDQLERLQAARGPDGQRFLLRRWLDAPEGLLLQRWLVWTFDPAYRLAIDLPPLSALPEGGKGIGLVMAWRVLERVLEDARCGELEPAAAGKKLGYLLEHAPARMRPWIWRTLHGQLADGLDRRLIDRLAPGLLGREC